MNNPKIEKILSSVEAFDSIKYAKQKKAAEFLLSNAKYRDVEKMSLKAFMKAARTSVKEVERRRAAERSGIGRVLAKGIQDATPKRVRRLW